MGCSRELSPRPESGGLTHRAIGQEFDKVLMLIHNAFHYNDRGKLTTTTHPNSDYLYSRLLFQGLTRVRENLAIIIIYNTNVFFHVLSILTNQDTSNVN